MGTLRVRALLRFGLRLLVSSLVVVLVMFTPRPEALPRWANLVLTGVGAFLAVCFLGKLLYDTFFYDRS